MNRVRLRSHPRKSHPTASRLTFEFGARLPRSSHQDRALFAVRRRLKPPPILRSHNECRFDRESSLTLQRWRLGRPTSLGIQIAAVDSAHDVAAEPAYRQTQPEFVVRRLRMTAAKLGKSDLLQ